MIGINFRPSVESDRKMIKSLFKEYEKDMSIPFEEIIDRCIKSRSFYMFCNDDIVVGMGGVRYAKRKNEYVIEHIAVVRDCLRCGIGKCIVKSLIDSIENKRKTLFGVVCIPIVAYAREGADNNAFYDKISSGYTVEEKKTKSIRRYIIDVEKLNGFI